MYDHINKALSLILSILIFLPAILIRYKFGTYLHPVSLLSFFWFLFTLAPILILFEAPINPASIGFILICIYSFSLSFIFFNWKNAFENNSNKIKSMKGIFSTRFLRYLFILVGMLSFIFSTASMMSHGFNLDSMVFNLLETSGQFASGRGTGDFESNIWSSAAISFTYLLPVLGGLVFPESTQRINRIFVSLFTIIPVFYFVATQSAKLIGYYSVGFFLAGFLLRKIYENDLILFNKKSIRNIAYLTAFSLLTVSITFLSRDEFSDFDNYKAVSELIQGSLFSYAFMQLYSFSDFFSYYIGYPSQFNYANDSNILGAYTATSIVQALGFEIDLAPGTYTEYYSYSDIYQTNIYTIFRGLIYDFGFAGSFFVFFIAGLTSNIFFHRLLSLRRSWFSCSIFLVTIVLFIASYLISPLMSRFMYLQAFSLYIILLTNDILTKRRRQAV